MKLRNLINTAVLTLAVATCAVFPLTGFAASEESVSSGSILETEDLFTERDLKQEADLTDAVYETLNDGAELRITEAGVYVLSGTAKNAVVYVEAGDDDKIELVLDGLNVENDDFPCIYVLNADKVFVTTGEESSLAVTGTFADDGDTHTDGVIFSKADLVLRGTAALTIRSSDNGVVCKDDLKITGGSYDITAASKAFEANDSILIAGGVFTLTAGSDGLHAENSEDESLGYIYIADGDFTIGAGDDAIHALSAVQIDGGTIRITASEGIEATYIQINGGTITIDASDDGINAAYKSGAYVPTIEINDGIITIVMASGDTDGIDSNGNLVINGGTVDVTGGSTFDYDGTAQYNGGTIIVNGQQVSAIPGPMGMVGTRGFGRRW